MTEVVSERLRLSLYRHAEFVSVSVFCVVNAEILKQVQDDEGVIRMTTDAILE
jgi:hypothetical protein